MARFRFEKKIIERYASILFLHRQISNSQKIIKTIRRSSMRIIFPTFNRESKRVTSRDGVIGRFIPSSGSSPTSWTREFFLRIPPPVSSTPSNVPLPHVQAPRARTRSNKTIGVGRRWAIKYASRVIWGTPVIIPSAARPRQRCCTRTLPSSFESNPETRRLRFNRQRSASHSSFLLRCCKIFLYLVNSTSEYTRSLIILNRLTKSSKKGQSRHEPRRFTSPNLEGTITTAPFFHYPNLSQSREKKKEKASLECKSPKNPIPPPRPSIIAVIYPSPSRGKNPPLFHSNEMMRR